MSKKDSFSDILRDSKTRPVLMVFTASWSGSAQLLEHGLADYKSGLNQDLNIRYFDQQEYTNLAAKMNVSTVPTSILIHRQEVLCRFTGVPPKHRLESMLDPYLAA